MTLVEFDIDIWRKFRLKVYTSDGREVRVICSDRKSKHPMIGLYLDNKGSENLICFRDCGFTSGSEPPVVMDLDSAFVDPKKPKVMETFRFIYLAVVKLWKERISIGRMAKLRFFNYLIDDEDKKERAD